MYLNGQDSVLSVWVRIALYPFIRQILIVNPHFPYPTSTIISKIIILLIVVVSPIYHVSPVILRLLLLPSIL